MRLMRQSVNLLQRCLYQTCGQAYFLFSQVKTSESFQRLKYSLFVWTSLEMGMQLTGVSVLNWPSLEIAWPLAFMNCHVGHHRGWGCSSQVYLHSTPFRSETRQCTFYRMKIIKWRKRRGRSRWGGEEGGGATKQRGGGCDEENKEKEEEEKTEEVMNEWMKTYL